MALSAAMFRESMRSNGTVRGHLADKAARIPDGTRVRTQFITRDRVKGEDERDDQRRDCLN